jgi:hypothetical protein
MAAKDYTQGSREAERLYWSIHEAGHAVAAYLSGYSIDYVSVLPTEVSEHGHAQYHNKGTRLGDDASDEEVNEDMRRLLRVDMAGAAAEYTAHAHAPLIEPLPYWQEVLEEGKLSSALMIEPLKLHAPLFKLAEEDPEYIAKEFGPQRLLPGVAEMVCENWGAVVEIAAALREKGRIDGEEVGAIMNRIDKEGK